MLTDKEIDHIAEKISARLVKYGLDVNNPLDMQADLLFLRHQRESAENFTSNVRRTFVYGGILSFIGGVSYVVGRIIVTALRGQ